MEAERGFRFPMQSTSRRCEAGLCRALLPEWCRRGFRSNALPSPASLFSNRHTLHDVSLNRLGPVHHFLLVGIAEGSNELVRTG